jgi:hypothetical protein
MTLLYSVLFPATCSTYFGWNIHPLSGARLNCIYSDSSTTTAGHTLFVNTICCKYSSIELLMMGECFTRNMKSILQEIKHCTRVSSCWNFFKIHIPTLVIFRNAPLCPRSTYIYQFLTSLRIKYDFFNRYEQMVF